MVIKATPKSDSLSEHGVLWCTRNKEKGNWSALDENGKWWYVFSSHLRNSDIYNIECFTSWKEVYEKRALAWTTQL